MELTNYYYFFQSFYLNIILFSDPDHPRARGNLAYYTDALAKSETQKKGDDGHITSELIAALAVEKPEPEYPEKQEYERLCRGENIRVNYFKNYFLVLYFYYVNIAF